MLFGKHRFALASWAIILIAAPTSTRAAEGFAADAKQHLLSALPPFIGDGLDVDAWGWFSDLQNDQKQSSNFWDAEFSLGITKSFNQRLAISAQGNFIDADGSARFELEQSYASVLLNERQGSFLTVGKFNANFGCEARDFWSRTTGTTSLLFGAQPQDLIGVMLTQPLGQSGLTLRPFLSADFQGQFEFDQSPSAGLTVECQPARELRFELTNWVGPGFVLFGGRHLPVPYPQGGYGADGSGVVANWQGPNLYADSGGTLYFVEASSRWQASHDLQLSGEALCATTSTHNGRFGWWGVLLQADYDITDRFHIFARWSYLNDSDWLITGIFQRVHEISAGAGYEFLDGLELRGEYRHDISNAVDDVNSFSIHLTFTI